MRAVLMGALRVVLVTAFLVTVIAVVLGRQQAEIRDERHAVVPRHQVISGYLFKKRVRHLSMLDVETGALESLRLQGGDRLDHAACAPWKDSAGRTHLAGMWAHKAGAGIETMGLAHFAGPDWTVLHQVETDHVPASPVCWFPDTTSRILYAGRDGKLYGFSFDEPEAEPRAVEWRTPAPSGLLLISDPLCPSDPGLAGLVIASLSFRPESAWPVASERHAELWWLRLSMDGSAIVAAGPLIAPDPSEAVSSAVDEELPSISIGADGSATLAYLAFRKIEATHHLRLAPLSCDGLGRFHADGASVVELPGKRIRARPAFSHDGRWVCAVPSLTTLVERVDRIAVREFLARPSTELRYSASTTPPPMPANPFVGPPRANLSTPAAAQAKERKRGRPDLVTRIQLDSDRS